LKTLSLNLPDGRCKRFRPSVSLSLAFSRRIRQQVEKRTDPKYSAPLLVRNSIIADSRRPSCF